MMCGESARHLSAVLFGSKQMEAIRTNTGTWMVQGVEYNEYPPPRNIIKAMERKWALPLIEEGAFRVRKLEYYQELEHDQLGDINEGRGLFHLHGHPMEVGSANEVYVWCASLPDMAPSFLTDIADEYDCIIRILKPMEFINRVASHLSRTGSGYRLQCGTISYARGDEVDKQTLNSQQFHFNVFQKARAFRHQMEYRISIINCTFQIDPGDSLDVKIGDCRDIIKIE